MFSTAEDALCLWEAVSLWIGPASLVRHLGYLQSGGAASISYKADMTQCS